MVEQPAKTIYIGGQNGVDADGKVVGPTLGEQASQALRNLATILESEGGEPGEHRALAIAVVDGHPFDEGVAAFQQVWNPADPPPAITVHVVAGLGPGVPRRDRRRRGRVSVSGRCAASPSRRARRTR